MDSKLYDDLMGIYIYTLEEFDGGELESKEKFKKTEDYLEVVSGLKKLCLLESINKEEKNMLFWGRAILGFYGLLDIFADMDKSACVKEFFDTRKNGGE